MSIPFRISFNVTFSPEFDTFITIAFFFDMIITTNTAFYQDGELIYKRKLIVLEYIKLWFWLDLAATFPYDSFIEATVENSGQSGQLLA
jgi:hyperpolarization activated cyclic nucleotide-gated potassium channel 2